LTVDSIRRSLVEAINHPLAVSMLWVYAFNVGHLTTIPRPSLSRFNMTSDACFSHMQVRSKAAANTTWPYFVSETITRLCDIVFVFA